MNRLEIQESIEKLSGCLFQEFEIEPNNIKLTSLLQLMAVQPIGDDKKINILFVCDKRNIKLFRKYCVVVYELSNLLWRGHNQEPILTKEISITENIDRIREVIDNNNMMQIIKGGVSKTEKFGPISCILHSEKTITTRSGIDLDDIVLSRFTMICPIKDIDIKLPFEIDSLSTYKKSFLLDILDKTRNINPVLSDEAKQKLKTFFIEKRDIENSEFTHRDLGYITTISKAVAKLCLSEQISVDHVEIAIRLYNRSLRLKR